MQKLQDGNASVEYLTGNREAIERSYSFAHIGQRLHQIYAELLSCTPSEVQLSASIGQAVLDSFVQPEQLFPIRLEP